MERKRNPETSKCVKKFKCKVIKMSSKQSAPSNLFLCPLGLATTTAAILLYKSQILRLLNPRLLFMYWRRSVKGVAVAKSSAAALSKVSKPNIDCIKECTNIYWWKSTNKLTIPLVVGWGGGLLGLRPSSGLPSRSRVPESTRLLVFFPT